jgi:beta-alanine degradation protein BauB
MQCRNFLQLGREKAFLIGMRFIISAVIAAFTFVLWTTSVSAQDPAVVNSKTIKVKFENERVRVLEAELPPGVKEQVHSHPAYVIYVLAGGKVRNYASDGKITEAELKTGDVLYREPLTHAAENIGNTTLHMILVELKEPKAETPKN